MFRTGYTAVKCRICTILTFSLFLDVQELAGFYVYCTQILSWLPPLIFTILVEADVSQTYAVVAVSSFLLVSITSLQCAAPWEDILEESGRSAVKTTLDLDPVE